LYSIAKRRYACACGKKFAEKNSFIKRYQRFSGEWNQAVKIRTIKGKTFKETAEIYGTSSSTIVRRFDQLSISEIIEVRELPKVFAIDEYKGDTREGKYQLIIADGITKEPIVILPNRYKKTIKNYLQQHGAKVEVVIMDMSPALKAAVIGALVKPVIVADRFHFVRYMYWELDKVRRRIQATWNDYERKKCKKMRYVFHRNSKKLTQEDRWYLDRYLSMSSELKEAYELKETFNNWFVQAKENGPDWIHILRIVVVTFCSVKYGVSTIDYFNDPVCNQNVFICLECNDITCLVSGFIYSRLNCDD